MDGKKKGRAGKRKKSAAALRGSVAPSGVINLAKLQAKESAPKKDETPKAAPTEKTQAKSEAPKASVQVASEAKDKKEEKKSPASKKQQAATKASAPAQASPSAQKKKNKKKKGTAVAQEPQPKPTEEKQEKPEDPERAALLKFSKIEKQIKASLTHLSSLRTILEIAWRPDNTSTVTFNAVHTLQRLFNLLSERGVLVFLPKKKTETKPPAAKKAKVEDAKDKKQQPQGKAQEEKQEGGQQSDSDFALSQYNSFRKLLLHLFHHRHEKIRVLALKVLMGFIQIETMERNSALGSFGFPESWMLRVVENLVTSELTDQGEIIESFASNYFQKYDDVRFYTLKVLTLVMDKKRAALNKQQQQSESKGKKENEVWTVESMPAKLFTASCYSIMQRVSMPTSKKQINSFWLPVPENTDKKKGEAKKANSKLHETLKRKREKEDEKKKKISGGAAVHHLIGNKKVFEDCWLSFLRLPLTPAVYKEILRHMDTHILPHMQNPIRVMDFLKDSYTIGGVISLLALHGLFILITKHNLDYPDFYANLYRLFQPDIFYVKYRAKFLKLATLFLTSTHLPAYLVAAFVKRMARLALTAPPAGALFAIAFIYNLLKRHPQCQVLASRGPGTLPTVAYESSADKGAVPDQPVLLLSAASTASTPDVQMNGSASSAEETKKRKIEENGEQKGEEDKSTPKKKAKTEEQPKQEETGKKGKRKRRGKRDSEANKTLETEKEKEKEKENEKQKQREKEQAQRELVAKLLHAGAEGSDPFIFEEMDMAKCNAMQSSLWEIKTLQQHYLPEVSKMAHVLETFFKNPAFELNDFVELSYQSLFETHMKRKVPTEVPLAFEEVTSLFSSTNFYGLTFQSEETETN